MKPSDQTAVPTSVLSLNTKPPAATIAPKKTWNTDRLGLRVASDFLSAGCAGALVAPLISIIDRYADFPNLLPQFRANCCNRSIMENASGAATLCESLKRSFKTLALRPHHILFSKPTALILMLYGGTYLTANTLDTAFSTVQNRKPSHVTAGTPKFAASSAANVGLCIYKDQVFVKLFGPPGATPRPVPPASYALFTIRDCLTIFASFNVPPLLAPKIDANLRDGWRKHVSGATAAQFAAPAFVQLFSTPLHLLGLDMYNRPKGLPGAPSLRERWNLVRGAWLPSALARIGRIVPAFGVGGVVNTKVRASLMGRLED